MELHIDCPRLWIRPYMSWLPILSLSIRDGYHSVGSQRMPSVSCRCQGISVSQLEKLFCPRPIFKPNFLSYFFCYQGRWELCWAESPLMLERG